MSGTFLTTAYKDRERVKLLGAKWDPTERRWYVPEGLDLVPFEAWLPAATATATSTQLAPRQGISLSQLLAGVSQAVNVAFPAGTWTRVEVVKLDLRKGHLYLELSERRSDGSAVAQARAVIWADTANTFVPEFERATGVILGAGIKLLVRAKPTLHALYGMSLVIDAIDPDYTLGDLEARKREIRARLQREGLLELNRQLLPPWDFNAVLVVAPQGGAGLGDFQAEADRLAHFGVCRFIYAFSRFQGEGAAIEIRNALLSALGAWSQANPQGPDAVVIIRGGGAVNDLAWLNDYELARCICELDTPVLTGIGHERDNTILDEVANRRFDTPSKVIAGIEQLIRQRTSEAQEAFAGIAKAATSTLHAVRRNVEQFRGNTERDAERILAGARQQVSDHLANVRIRSSMQLRQASEFTRDEFGQVREQVHRSLLESKASLPSLLAEVRLNADRVMTAGATGVDSAWHLITSEARAQQQRGAADVHQTFSAIEALAIRTIGDAQTKTQSLMREVAGQGPDKTLGRGFAVIRRNDGQTVTRAHALSPDQVIQIQFSDGAITATTRRPSGGKP